MGLVFAAMFSWAHLWYHYGWGEFQGWVRNLHIQRYQYSFGVGFLLAMLPGFLFFETYAYLGLRRCKFANTLRPDDAKSPEKPVARAPGS
ncbi:MAG: hypothetical protein ACI89L_002043 [Phycisphaerales bacterium]|jgi:hypothetical protein